MYTTTCTSKTDIKQEIDNFLSNLLLVVNFTSLLDFVYIFQNIPHDDVATSFLIPLTPACQ